MEIGNFNISYVIFTTMRKTYIKRLMITVVLLGIVLGINLYLWSKYMDTNTVFDLIYILVVTFMWNFFVEEPYLKDWRQSTFKSI